MNNKLINTILTLSGFQRKAFFSNMRRNGQGALLQSKAVRDALKKAGDEDKLEQHRRACITGYQVKKLRVENKEGTHKFIHEFTECEI